jgi:hypothetical protein
VLATVFFSVLSDGHASSTAFVRTAAIVVALVVASLALSFRLPKSARMDI